MAAEARLADVPQDPEAVSVIGEAPVLMEDRSFRARVVQIAALKAHGMNLKQIAEKLGLQYGTVKGIVYKASKEGIINYDDPFERFEQQLLPKVVDNIEFWLDKQDKKMTIEAAKGGGIFKAHQAIRVEGETPQTVLALKIEMPPSGSTPKAITGRVVGKPRRELTSGPE